MIDRRSQGIYTLHATLLAVEIVGLWVGLAALSAPLRLYTYYSLQPAWTYWFAIAAGLMIAMRFLQRDDVNLLTLGWAAAAQFATRQVAGVAGGIFTLAVATKDAGISRVFVAYYLPTVWVLLILSNRFQPMWLARILRWRERAVPILLMGRAENFPALEHWLDSQKALGLDPVGTIEYHGARTCYDLPVVGTFDDVGAAIERTGARQILMLELPRSPEEAAHLTHACSTRGCRLMIHNNLVVQLDRPLRALSHHGRSFLVLHDEPLENMANRLVKRGLDLALALVAVVVVVPPLAIAVAIAQALQSPGRLFYIQLRSGRDGRDFRIMKFRTMHEAGDERARQAGQPGERVFAFGRWLRRTSLDEIPQFLNVLAGDMSVVGPRPHLREDDEAFRRSAELYRMRFFVKPGITGMAQSRGFRGEAVTVKDVEQRILLDLIYIRSWSIWLDLAIVARTVTQVIRPPKSAC